MMMMMIIIIIITIISSLHIFLHFQANIFVRC